MIVNETFGRSGHLSSRILLGAAAFWDVSQSEADAAIELALSFGVNHLDVAASYGDAELRVGDWIHRHGRPFFLATKTGERTFSKASEEIRRSLYRLHVDHVDLLQLHNLVDPAEWEIALGPGGALEAAIRAREEGLVRFIGVTGHGITTPRMHRQALERFDFDSVLFPYSFLMAQNKEYLAAATDLIDYCRVHNVAVQAIKTLVQRPWGNDPQTRTTWYRPLEDQAAIDAAVHWIMAQPRVFLNSAGDVHLLPRILEAADRFEQAPSPADIEGLITRLEMQPLFT
ncbi:MAG TPA: aldo/keto reductase [Anaerolineaceae bacterium]|nr:aldo/keto reductase [Anaerolineaceae bacterium]